MKKNKLQRKSTKETFFKDNRKFFGGFILIFTMIILLQATFAWSSYAEWVKNHMQTNPEAIAVQIEEKFEQESLMVYGVEVQKEVKVKNIASRPAIVRVKLREYLLPFVVDLSNGQGQGNGNLKLKFKESGDQVIEPQTVSSWMEGGLVDSGLEKDRQPLYYVAKLPIKDQDYLFSDGGRPSALEGIALQFHSSVKQMDQAAGTDPTWYYEEGYFYYSKVLSGGATTEIELLQAVSQMSSGLSNDYKHSLYYLDVEAYGVTPSREGLSKWTSSATVLTMLANDPNFDNK